MDKLLAETEPYELDYFDVVELIFTSLDITLGVRPPACDNWLGMSEYIWATVN